MRAARSASLKRGLVCRIGAKRFGHPMKTGRSIMGQSPSWVNDLGGHVIETVGVWSLSCWNLGFEPAETIVLTDCTDYEYHCPVAIIECVPNVSEGRRPEVV